ncbi:MAG: twin-arginine translocase TatA/TatE family subunit [Peptococcaceae bacterium]|jgi:Tat protein translocase TatB subunit|nr:twin-arginine translocase TatA/TatE family subunit [Peptococcaceae bacterium]
MNFTEIVFLLIIGLIVFGPEELPNVARTVGKFLAEFRQVKGDLTKEFKDSLAEPLGEITHTLKEPLREVTQALNDPLGKINEMQPEAKTEKTDKKLQEEFLTYEETGVEADTDQDQAIHVSTQHTDPLKDLPEDMVRYDKDKNISR